MQCQNPPVASLPAQPSPPTPLPAQSLLKKQTSIVSQPSQHNSFQRFLNVLSSDHARKAQELAQGTLSNAQDKKGCQTLQSSKPEENVQHSRSRDKRRRLPKQKTSKKQPAKDKEQSVSLSSNIVSNVSEAEVSSISHAVLPVLSESQSKQFIYNSITVSEDYVGLLTRSQYQSGEVIDNYTNKDTLPVCPLQIPQQPTLNFNQPVLSQQPVLPQVQKVIAHQLAVKDEEIDYQPKKSPIRGHYQESMQENKEKTGNQNLNAGQIDGNDRFQRKGNNYLEQRQWNYKSKMCYDFLKGRCKKSTNQCTYAHGYDDLKPQRRLRFVCRNFNRGFCKKPQDQCKFYHQKPRDRQHSPQLSDHSSQSDEQRRKINKTDQAVKKDQDKEKKEFKNLEREQEEQRRDQRREDKREERRDERKEDRRDEKREERREDKKDERRQERKQRKDDRKHSRRSQQRVEDKKFDKVSEKRQNGKKYAEPLQNISISEANPALVSPFPYFSFVSGYFAPNSYPQQPYINRPDQMPNVAQNNHNMQYGYSSFYAPMYISPPYGHVPQNNSFFANQNPQLNNQSRPNMTGFQQPATPFPQNYAANGIPGHFPSFYTCFVPQFPNQQRPNFTNNTSNDSLTPPNSDCEGPLNSTMDEKRQRDRTSRQHKRNSSKERSKDRRQKKHHRR